MQSATAAIAFRAVYLKLIVLGAIWGSSFLAQKIALQAWSYEQIVDGRMVTAAATLSLLTLLRHDPWPAGVRFWGLVSVSGILIGVSNLLVPFALVDTSSGLSAVIITTIPLFAAAFVLMLVRHEAPTASQAAGLTVGFVGAVVAIEPWRQGMAARTLISVAALVLAAALLGLNSAYSRRFLSDRPDSSLVVIACSMVGGAAALLVFTAPIVTHQSWSFSPQAILAVCYLGVFPTGIAYVLLFGLIRDVGVTRASTANYLIPIVAIILGWIALREPMRGTLLVGGSFVVTGVALTDGRLRFRKLFRAHA